MNLLGLKAKPTLHEKPRQMHSSRVVLGINESITSQHMVNVGGHDFVVHPNVFSPAVFVDTQFFAPLVAARAGSRLLEIGTGTGAVGALAALQGASFVVATDINPAAVANANANFAAHGLEHKSSVRLGDVFSPVAAAEKFDAIFWNVPFMHIDKHELSMLEQALYDPEYRSLELYLAGAAQHLQEKGRVLIGFSFSHGHQKALEGLAAKYGWMLRVIGEEVTPIPPSEEGADFISVQLIEATPRRADQ